MGSSPSLDQFAEQVATQADDRWLTSFVESVQQHIKETEGVALFVQPRQREARGDLEPLAHVGEVPALPQGSLQGLPRRAAGGLLLPIPSLAEGSGALWLGTPQEAEAVQLQLRGFLAVAGIGLARRQQVREAELQRTARDHFFSMVNHDLKSPLASVKAMADLLVRKVQRGTLDPATEAGRADLLERLGFLSRRVKDMALMIDEIGDVSTIERGRILLNPTQADLGSLVRISVDRMEQASERSIQIEHAENSRLPVLVDEIRLIQVCHILLQNATAYSEPETPIVVRLTRQEGKAAQVSIEDQGMGIREETQQRLFYEYGRSVQERSTGLGVGLYIASALLQAHGGTLALTSQPGRGTTVQFTLPLVATD